MNHEKVKEPFSEVEQFETENGTKLEVGGEVLCKPTYIRQRLPAVVENLYWNPRGFPGGKFERRDGHVCVLNASIRFTVPDDHEYSHMDGKTVRIESYNLDFCIGTTEEIYRDRRGCNVVRE